MIEMINIVDIQLINRNLQFLQNLEFIIIPIYDILEIDFLFTIILKYKIITIHKGNVTLCLKWYVIIGID